MTLSRRIQLISVWCGPAMAVIFGPGFLLAGFIPPPSPTLDAVHIAHIYRDHANAIHAGLILTVVASALLGPYFTVISVQMRRMEGSRPVLAYLQLALGALTIIEFIVPVMIMQVAAFRPGRDPAIVQTLNDIGWFMFLGVTTTFVLQLFVIGVAILGDSRENPIFPRWVGYFNVWMATLFTPGNVLVFFHSGPLAWNGIFEWWLQFVAFLLWFPTNTLYLLRAVKNDDYEPSTPGDADIRSQLVALQAEVQ